MGSARDSCKAFAGAMLAVAALSAASDAPCAPAWEPRSSNEARVQAERRWHTVRTHAHAQMPDTMYASTPDPAPPPHPVPVAADTTRTLAQSAGEGTHRIALFPSAGDALGRQGFARVINHSDVEGEVRIDAFDDAGTPYGPLTLTLGAGRTVHFNSDDLESGKPDKRLDGATGPPGQGDWRLVLSSTLELEVLAYIRTGDGFLTSMHDLVPRTEAGYRVPIFNPGSNPNQVSWLRLINPGAQPTRVRIEGVDEAGHSPGVGVELSLAGGAARTLSASALESGAGLSGALGDGEGKWQLEVSADQPIEVVNVLSTPTGHLTNLSTAPGDAGTGDDGVTTAHAVALFPSAGDALGRQGFARVINHSDVEGEVRIDAFDDAGTPYGPLTLTLGAGRTVHFNSDDLESGKPDKRLDGATGPPGQGDWRLVLSSTLEFEVLAYIRTGDGFLTSMHDLVPRTEAGYRVPIFNPGSNPNQVSWLRLINPGAQPTRVRIEGVDEAGHSPGVGVELSLAGGAARTLSASALESGAGLSGALGDGEGKWQLEVSADQPIEVVNVLSTPTGHLTNLSTAPTTTMSRETAAAVFCAHISEPIVQSKCIACHVAGGVSGNTRLVFTRSTLPEHETHNLQMFEDFIAEVNDGANAVLNKIRGVAHGGGTQVAQGTAEYGHMARFLRLLGENVSTAALTPRILFDTVQMAPTRKVLRRAALIFAGRAPTDAEYAAAQGSTQVLRNTIRALMTGSEFHEFLIRAANDRLLTNRSGQVIDANLGFYVDFVNESYRRIAAAHASGDERDWTRFYRWNDRTQHGFRRAPLELIAHVVENDRPYTEILTANYIMANPWSAAAYGASTRFDDPDNVHEFQPSRIVSYYREGDGFQGEYDPIVGASRVFDPGPLITHYPHGGVLNTTAFLYRYPTTATNRNRARSRWTYYHFLGLDIERSASRTTDPVALADTNNPTLRNPACTVCHRVLDPVAGTFQNYGDEGFYKDQWGGRDSLDEFYKNDGASGYRAGDTWYRDMRPPGFNGERAPSSDNSVQWLAQQVVADPRFAEATVKFWWPAIMGSEVAVPPEDEGDVDFEGLLLAANAQGAEVERLARGFRSGFHGRSAYNLKDLLVEIVLSKWFRADAVEDADPVRQVALRDAGARRLLTPEELSRKTAALTGVEWGRTIGTSCWPECRRRPSALTDEYRLLYGGIDSDGITERARDITTVMGGVALRHAMQVSCSVVMREFYLLPESGRRLFAGINQNVIPSRGAATIRNKLVELYEKLLGVEVTPQSLDVEAAYRLFADVVRNGPRSRDDWFATYGWFAYWECEWWNDKLFLEGIFDDALVENENEDGWTWYDYDWDRVQPFIDSLDWSDPHHAARAWVVVLTYLLADYRYLYL